MLCNKNALRRTAQSLQKLTGLQQIRYLSLHEYQSQALLKEFQMPVPRGQVAASPGEVEKIIENLGGKGVIKSQILKGGRGKGSFDNGLQGGIQLAESPIAGKEIATKMLGHRLKTKQTSGKGLTVNKVYVAETIKYNEEWYLAMTIDRENYTPVIIISKSGGVDIEKLAKEEPEKVLKFNFSLTHGLTDDVVSEVFKTLGISTEETSRLRHILTQMSKLFMEKDATLLEINPLVRSSGGIFTCLDSKFSFDNAAKVRQKELFSQQDFDHEVSEEVEAENYGLVYVRMDGNIGNVVNGAGLAMATNDAIAHYSGASANFLDAGGQATKETMQKAFEIILRDSRVKAILINIYGGIIKCDMIAESIIGAATELGPFPVPIVVRLQGTNSEEGLRLLEEADLDLHTASDFGEAAKKVVELANSQ